MRKQDKINKSLYLLIWDIQELANKNNYFHYKEIKEFNSIDEADEYFNNTDLVFEDEGKVKYTINGGSVNKLDDLIKNQGYNYQLVKVK